MGISYKRETPIPVKARLRQAQVTTAGGRSIKAFMRGDSGIGLDQANGNIYVACDLTVEEADGLGRALIELAAQVLRGC